MERSFLSQVAHLYYHEVIQSEGLSFDEICFVFPNRRAGLFFRKELQRIIETPIFAPMVLSINDLFLRNSDLIQADRVDLLFVLYQVYTRHIKEEVLSFDKFIDFGVTLLKDFDELDKYQIDVEVFFSNVEELNSIKVDYLSEEQKFLVYKFWGHVIPENGEQKLFQEKFENLWGKMYSIYFDFKAELNKRGMAYDGMIFRAVIEDIERTEKTIEFEYKRYVFVGFNAMNKTENRLLRFFQRVGDYYFDYPQWVVDMKDTAGYFADQNLALFKSRYDISSYKGDVSLEVKEINTYAIPSNVGQVQVIPHILDKLGVSTQLDHVDGVIRQEKAIDTAIILPDEGLLVPTIYALPEFNEGVNVTMGYPLQNTSIAQFISNVIYLYKNRRKEEFYYKYILKVLQHPFVRKYERANDIVKTINREKLIYATPVQLGLGSIASVDNTVHLLQLIFAYEGQVEGVDIDSKKDFSFIDFLLEMIEEIRAILLNNRQNSVGKVETVDVDQEDIQSSLLDIEYIDKYVFNLRHIRTNIEEFEVGEISLFDLILQMTSVSNVPFRGEPVQGLQVMGALESRNLDFKNIIILSFNDEKIPRRQELNSFVPYSLRKAYELPTLDYNDKLYAYNFYRMLHRAENIYFVYDSRVEGVSKNNEISRYYHQINYLYSHLFEIKDNKVKFEGISDELNFDINIEKDNDKVKKQLSRYYSRGIDRKVMSASALNNYIDCSLKFYFSNVLDLREDKALSEEVDMGELGTMFHTSMEMIYESYKGKKVSTDVINSFKQTNIEGIIESAIKNVSKVKEIKGLMLLNKIIVSELVYNTLEFDKKRTPFTYIDTEYKIKDVTVPIRVDGEDCFVNFKGYIDRIDEKDGNYYIIDYKTGTMTGKMHVKDVADMFDSDHKKRPKEVMQALIYCYLLRENKEKFTEVSTARLTPYIYAVKNLYATDLSYGEPKNKKDLDSECFNDIYNDFEVEFKRVLSDIFNPKIPFKKTGISEHCDWCDYSYICSKQSNKE